MNGAEGLASMATRLEAILGGAPDAGIDELIAEASAETDPFSGLTGTELAKETLRYRLDLWCNELWNLVDEMPAVMA